MPVYFTEDKRGRDEIKAMFIAEFAQSDMTCLLENIFEDGISKVTLSYKVKNVGNTAIVDLIVEDKDNPHEISPDNQTGTIHETHH